MRFVDTTTLKFQEVADSEVCELKNGYCILSHRWGDEEIQFSDVLSASTEVSKKLGYSKLFGACALARSLGHSLIWIDTCCINKSDAVELSEAINSMYRWYAESSVCIAYLSDVSNSDRIAESQWFGRGWTLQELVAPENVQFYNTNWDYLGDKRALHDLLTKRTNIPMDVLHNARPPQSCSVAQRMSWAANRTTTRIEDRAYSLMGLFDVNMPMIYGERERAFLRLQEQIIARSSDESIFVWDLEALGGSSKDPRLLSTGLLAPSPDCFARSGNVISIGPSEGFRTDQFGLTIRLSVAWHSIGTYRATLQATRFDSGYPCAIILKKLDRENLYVRTTSSAGESIITGSLTAQKVSVTTPLQSSRYVPVDTYPGFWVRKLELYPAYLDICHIISRRRNKDEDRLMLPNCAFGTSGVILIHPIQQSTKGSCWIKLGFEPTHCKPVCSVSLLWSEFDESSSAVREMLKEAEALISCQRVDRREEMSIFDDTWIHSKDPVSSKYGYHHDSRSGQVDTDGGFTFIFKKPFFNLEISVTKAHDMKAPGPRKGEVWAIDIIMGEVDTRLPPMERESTSCWRCF